MLEIGIVGNPNSGKTTLFNELTGSKQRVGNWPGVTVERKEGTVSYEGRQMTVVDLPGTYSLTVASDELSLDERIACDYIASGSARLIVNIIDATNLERNLYLTTQLLEMGVPVIVALNMMDIVRKENTTIDTKQLSATLNCPVVELEAVKKKGLDNLLMAIVSYQTSDFPHLDSSAVIYPLPIEEAILSLASPTVERWQAVRLLEEDCLIQNELSDEVNKVAERCKQAVCDAMDEDADILVAEARYQFITRHVKACIRQGVNQGKKLTQKIDAVVLNRFLGIPIFLLVMYSMFLFAINVGGVFQDFFDIASDTLFVQGPTYLLQQVHAPNWLISLLAQGVGKGLNTVLTFIPVIGGMFFFLSILEQSGYMVRAAFVVDRVMRAIGLPGKSFVPMIVGFGCNVPAVLATRTLENRRDRILTVLMSPFMSCGARLAIFAVFTAAFFPVGGQNIVFALYLIGIIVAILTGLFLRKTILRGEPAPFVLELPQYHLPTMQSLFVHTWQRLKGFVLKAGKIIVPICMLLGFLNSFTLTGHLVLDGSTESLLSELGKFLTPLFFPMGLTENNWPATVGLLSGVLAKEVVVGTLNSLYSQASHLTVAIPSFDLWLGLKAALLSIVDNAKELGETMANPIAASAPAHSVDQGVMGQMYVRFGSRVNAFAYLLFVLLYFPCVSTVAAMSRELGKLWAWFSVAWTTGVAYGAAVFFYQAATISEHSLQSCLWMGGVIVSFVVVLLGMKWFSPQEADMQESA
jgi:ferrous iron transport protein B